ncbi:MAG: 1,4-alpha-glucan branching enzyme, partial [Lachnospiraceae bacterium]|nr:1,4-alpha-glucan branching enzyme [Lachnospiraceae bacterium]
MNKRLENWVNWVLYDELVKGTLNAPKHLLGIHDYGDGQVITAYRPHAVQVCVTTVTGKNPIHMEELAPDFYGIYFDTKKFKGTKYRIQTKYEDGTTVLTADCYAFY